MTFHPISAMN